MIADIVLENADIALSGLQSLIMLFYETAMLIYTTVYAFNRVFIAFKLVTEVLSEILNLCHE